MFCKNCGDEIKGAVSFCSNCGKEVKINRFDVLKERLIFFFQNNKRNIITAFIIIAVIFIFLILIDSSPINQEQDNSHELNYKQNNVASSVVNIICRSKDGTEVTGGSGTIITEDGIILTNAHIIPQRNGLADVDSNSCVVSLPDELTGQAKEIYWAEPIIIPDLSEEYDIAILEINDVYVNDNDESFGVFPNTFPVFKSAPSCQNTSIKLGDSIKIYGYPVTSGGYNLTVTEGIISSFNDDGTILTSAKVDSGNSGGLAIDSDNCFVGIPSAIVGGDYQNLGVIISPDLISEFIDKIPNN